MPKDNYTLEQRQTYGCAGCNAMGEELHSPACPHEPRQDAPVALPLKWLRPAQYESWLRKVDDPDWYEHRYRDAKDRAMVSAIRDLRETLTQLSEALATVERLTRAAEGVVDVWDGPKYKLEMQPKIEALRKLLASGKEGGPDA